ncbi:MAG TPA: CheR family methyltransferase [Ramlibacter sp.]|jgi:chemotaxis protein methyltransferase CheR|uniref:CheR family methyltransferase n=1 Tax=Ramlibacter sp. TaxID=1917967 RepID=UPI002D53FE4A|nr:CheR family methyltransferase [Ramlibacter sp.]HZY19172.1 CheR family methyltransferase [Ramlibacter sp.]
MSAVSPFAAPPGDRDVGFDAADFQRVRTLIRAKAGIDLHPGKQNMVYGRLSRRLRETRHESFRSYLDALERAGGEEWQEFINCLTTNLTSFFREAHHFEMLAAQLRSTPAPSWRIWSCAASTGEEPYSIAMTAIETLGASAPVRIDASDIDTRVLATAREGVYSLESVQSLGEDRLRRFFLRGSGPNAGKARIKPEVRQMVQLRPFNLLSGSWDTGSYDAVFCRNVMIYFDRPTQRQVLQRLHAVIRPGGLLFVGHSENFSEHRDLFQLTGKTVYRRP